MCDGMTELWMASMTRNYQHGTQKPSTTSIFSIESSEIYIFYGDLVLTLQNCDGIQRLLFMLLARIFTNFFVNLSLATRFFKTFNSGKYAIAHI